MTGYRESARFPGTQQVCLPLAPIHCLLPLNLQAILLLRFRGQACQEQGGPFSDQRLRPWHPRWSGWVPMKGSWVSPHQTPLGGTLPGVRGTRPRLGPPRVLGPRWESERRLRTPACVACLGRLPEPAPQPRQPPGQRNFPLDPAGSLRGRPARVPAPSRKLAPAEPAARDPVPRTPHGRPPARRAPWPSDRRGLVVTHRRV